MKFLVDESAGLSIVRHLESFGHDVASVQEDRPGIEDSEVCVWANREGRVIITNDKDFGRLVFLGRLTSRGVILLRLQDERAANKVRVVSNILAGYEERLADHFLVASESEVRIRPLPRNSSGLDT